MKISKDARKMSRELIRASFSDGRLDESKVRVVVQQLVDKKPRNYLEVLKDYQRYVRLELEKRHAIIESAAKLDKRTRDKIEASLRERYGSDVTTEFKVTPELIGGLRVKLGSDVWDNSVRNRLSRLENELIHA